MSTNQDQGSSNNTPIKVAQLVFIGTIITAIFTLGPSIINNWDKFFPKKEQPIAPGPLPDTTNIKTYNPPKRRLPNKDKDSPKVSDVKNPNIPESIPLENSSQLSPGSKLPNNPSNKQKFTLTIMRNQNDAVYINGKLDSTNGMLIQMIVLENEEYSIKIGSCPEEKVIVTKNYTINNCH